MFASLIPPLALAATVDRVPEDFPTIQRAIDQGDAPTIHVAAGAWAGAVLSRPVHLVADGAIIVEGVRLGPTRAGFVLPGRASGSTIEGFVFDCTSRRLDLGVYGSEARMHSVADRIEVVDNRFAGCVQAITNAGGPVEACRSEAVDGGSWWTIRNNTIDGLASRTDRGGAGGGVGVLLYNVLGADVFGNRFTGSVQDDARFATSGVALAGCIDCTVSDNQFEVSGGRFWYSAVSNAGALLDGAVASRNLLLSGNDAYGDSAPWLGVAFVSRGSSATALQDNLGVAYVDHERCGDGDLYTIE
ncbi:MAG TPA: hypothetical protein ENK18_03840 [Deltaproteobacteria bacterium]|nr:hypothetical protein [Deltaproteobacteria bacterium]